jgi:L-iditol 2-dehydrogenase
MRAFFLHNPRDFPHHVQVKEVPNPECGEDEILIKVAACAVCGTDVKKFFKGHKLIKSYPVITGHEFSGIVVQVGSKVREFEVLTPSGREKRGYREGDRVVVAPVVACEKCSNCLQGRPEACENREDIGFNYNGGFAEYVTIPGKILKKQIPPVYFIPDNVSFYGAAIAEPLACAIHAQSKVFRYLSWDKKEKRYDFEVGIKPQDVVVVIGGGPLGCMHAELARAWGAGCVIIAQRSTHKLELAKKMQVAHRYVQNSKSHILKEEVEQITQGKMADVVITACSGAEAQLQAFEVIKKGGFISFFGGISEKLVEIPTNQIHYNGPLVGGTSGASPYHLEIALSLMSQDKIDPTKYITHVLNLDFLEKMLFLKGIPQKDIPGFSSLEESAATIKKEKGVSYLDFLLNEEGSISIPSDIPGKIRFFKDSVVKALVVPSLSPSEGIISLTEMSILQRKEKLIQLIG